MAIVRTDPLWKTSVQRSQYIFAPAISFPLAGIGGPERSLQEALNWWPFHPTNVIECRDDAVAVLRTLHGNDTVMPQDITKMDPGDYASSEGIVFTAPCVSCRHFSMNDKGEDIAMILKLLDMIKELAGRPRRPLRWALSENVESITYDRRWGNLWKQMQEWWVENMPGWTRLRLQLMNARECELPQNRPRAMTYSHSKVYDEVVGGMPEYPGRRPEPHLEDFLAAVTDLKA